MARDRYGTIDYSIPVRRIVIGIVVVLLLGIFLIWRIDSPRVERFRVMIIDAIVPKFEWASAPATRVVRMFDDYQSYERIYQQNQELRRELQQMKAWKEAAIQLEQQNAKLLDLNNVRLDADLTYITGVVMADSGTQFRQSVIVNVGARDGVMNGWAAMDGLGLVGRISGVGNSTARVVLLTDPASRLPVTVQPSGQKAIVGGDSGPLPLIEFLENPEQVRPGDRLVTSGDGGVFPSGLLVGQVIEMPDSRLRVRLSADYERLEFLRVLRSRSIERIDDAGPLLTPEEAGAEPDAAIEDAIDAAIDEAAAAGSDG